MSHNVARDQRRGARGTVEARRRRRMRPTLMALEDRRLLSTVVVDNSGGTTKVTNAPVSGHSAPVSGGRPASEGGTTKLTNAAVSDNPASGNIVPGLGFAGLNGMDGNNCNCYPPDTNAAVNANYVVETVNTEIVVFDKAGNKLFSETLNKLYGQPSAGDVYVVWDPLASRWYVDSIDGNNNADLLFAISKDANPLDGFSTQYVIPLAAPGDIADFPKFGYNNDDITLSANDYFNPNSSVLKVTVINKAKALAGTLSYVQLVPSPQFRALVPAQQTTAQPRDPIWFIGSPYLYPGQTNNVIRVTELTDPFGSAAFTDYYLSVDTYGGYPHRVDQPGGLRTVEANDNTTTQVFQYGDTLVTAFPASTAANGHNYPKVHYYEVDVTSGSPVLKLQGVIDPGPGVAAFFPTVAMNPTTGDLGLTWMESSSSEYVSMWVGTVSAAGALSVYDAAPGVTYEVYSHRNGDYSSVVYDPASNSFWAANEYAGADNGSVIWDTWIQQFSPSSDVSTPSAPAASPPPSSSSTALTALDLALDDLSTTATGTASWVNNVSDVPSIDLTRVALASPFAKQKRV